MTLQEEPICELSNRRDQCACRCRVGTSHRACRLRGVFDERVGSIDPPGPAIVGQRISGETGLRILHRKLTFWMIEIDPLPTSPLPRCTFAVWHHCS
jgi:hypothetical protein